MYNLYKCCFGQVLSIFIAISIIAQTNLLNKRVEYFFFLIYIAVYLMILIASIIYILIKKPKNVSGHRLILKYAIAGLFDFFGGYFLNLGFKGATAYFIILLTQMIYPMSVIAEILIFKKGNFNYKKIAAFIALAAACFYINQQQNLETFTYQVKNILFALLSNAFYLSNTFLQGFILPHVEAPVFLFNFSCFGILVGIIVSVTMDLNQLSFQYLSSFYKEHYLTVLFFGISLAAFYLGASPYIGRFGGTAFNGSIITSSVYFGLYYMYNTGFKPMIFVCFIICIAASVILVIMEKKEVGCDIEIENSKENDFI